jgi:hypothetical protein
LELFKVVSEPNLTLNGRNLCFNIDAVHLFKVISLLIPTTNVCVALGFGVNDWMGQLLMLKVSILKVVECPTF